MRMGKNSNARKAHIQLACNCVEISHLCEHANRKCNAANLPLSLTNPPNVVDQHLHSNKKKYTNDNDELAVTISVL